MALPRLDAAGQTDVGLQRKRNEDSYKVLLPPPTAPQAARGALFVVADGMGGMGGGDIASKAVVDELIRRFYGEGGNQELQPRLGEALESANRYVREQAGRIGLKRIGSTAAGLALTGSSQALVFNVGDSRVYRLRGADIQQLSHDQSMMELQIASGVVTEEEARQERSSNLTAFLGQPMPVGPHFQSADVQPGDVFILCSDGLWSLAKDDEIARIVRGTPAQDAVRRLIQLAHARGAPDNVTVIVVRVGAAPRRLLPWLIGGLLAAGLVIAAGILLASGALSGGAAPSATRQRTPTTIAASAGTASPAPPSLSPTSTQSPENVLLVVSLTPTATPTLTATATATITPSATATFTPSPTPTASRTPAPSATPTITPSPTATDTATPRPTTTATPTDTPSPTATLPPTATPRPSATASDTPPPTATPRPSATATLEPTVTLIPEIGAQAVTPSATPFQIDRFQVILPLARAPQGVTLAQAAGLRPNLNEIETVPLLEGVRVRVIGPGIRIGSGDAQQRWWPVILPDAPGGIRSGWLPETALANAIPPVPQAVVSAPSINVRAGDGTVFAAIGTLNSGAVVEITGRSSRSGWYQVRLADGRLGWVSNEIVIVVGDVTAIPPVEPPPLPPTPETTPEAPAPTPEVTPEAPAAAEG